MKRVYLVCAALLLLCVSGSVRAQDDVDLLDGLVAYWKMDETSGVRYDAHANHDLTDNNTVGYTSGIIGNAAMSVAGNNEYLNASGVFSTSLLSVSGWFTAGTSTAIFMQLLGGEDIETQLYYNASYDNVYVTLVEYDGAIECEEWAYFSVDETALSHAVLVQDRASQVIYVYWNGALESTLDYSTCGDLPDSRDYDIRFLSNSALVDEVALYDRLLNSDEIDTLYNAGDGLSYDEFGMYRSSGTSYNGVISYWSLDEGTGTRYDSQGTNHLTPTGSPGNTAGRVGSAVDLTGTEYLSLASGNIVTGSESFSILGWFATDEECATAGDCTAMAVWGPAFDDREWRLSYYANSIYANVQTSSGIVPLYIQATPGNWHAVGLIYNAAAETCALRVDSHTTQAACTGANFGTDTPLYIGYDGTDKLIGVVDEVVMFDRAITETTWATFHNGGFGAGYYDLVQQSVYYAYLPMVKRNSSIAGADTCDGVTCPDGQHCLDGTCVNDTDIEGIIEIDYESASWQQWAEIFDDLFSPVLKQIEELRVAIETMNADACGNISETDAFVPSGDDLEFGEDQTTLEVVYNLGLALGKPVAYVRVLRSYDILGLNYMTITISYFVVVFLFFGFITAYVIGMRLIRGALDLLKWIYEWIPAKST